MVIPIKVSNLSFLFSLSPGVCLASELSFLQQPNDVIAVRDRPLMLDCRVQGEEPVMVTWRKNGVPLPTGPRVQVLENGTLLIQRFQKRRDGGDADMGEYDCTVQNRYGLLVSRKAKVLLACKWSTMANVVTSRLFVREMTDKVWSNSTVSRLRPLVMGEGFDTNLIQTFFLQN